MLVRFSSIATESLLMFSDVAIQLIKMMGASGAIPGAIGADDIPAALVELRQRLQDATPPAEASAPEQDAGDGEELREPPIILASRAAPLIDILERASAGKAPVMWEPM